MCDAYEGETQQRHGRTKESGSKTKNNRIFNRAIEPTVSVCICVWRAIAYVAQRQKRSDWGWTTQFVYFTRGYKKKTPSQMRMGEIRNDNEISWHWLTSRRRATGGKKERERRRGWEDTSTEIRNNKSTARIKMHANIRRCVSMFFSSFFFLISTFDSVYALQFVYARNASREGGWVSCRSNRNASSFHVAYCLAFILLRVA